MAGGIHEQEYHHISLSVEISAASVGLTKLSLGELWFFPAIHSVASSCVPWPRNMYGLQRDHAMIFLHEITHVLQTSWEFWRHVVNML